MLRAERSRLLHKFKMQRYRADDRGIGWELTFEQWLKIWVTSGHLHERGRGAGKYVMARYGDQGPYAVGNVFVTTHGQNVVDANQSRVWKASTRAKMSAQRRGNKYRLGIPHSIEVRAKMSAANSKLSPDQIKHIQISRQTPAVELACSYGVSAETIRRVRRKESMD